MQKLYYVFLLIVTISVNSYGQFISTVPQHNESFYEPVMIGSEIPIELSVYTNNIDSLKKNGSEYSLSIVVTNFICFSNDWTTIINSCHFLIDKYTFQPSTIIDPELGEVGISEWSGTYKIGDNYCDGEDWPSSEVYSNGEIVKLENGFPKYIYYLQHQLSYETPGDPNSQFGSLAPEDDGKMYVNIWLTYDPVVVADFPVNVTSDECETFSITPNPSTDGNFVINSDKDVLQVKIYDISGSLINELKQKEINSNLNTGIYIIEVQTDKGTETGKLIIE